MAALWLALSALTTLTRAQVTVTVPAGCNVVVAGTGGTTGPGGTVGAGGIVVMPDPFPDPGGTFTVNPAGNTLLGWGLLGDLSVASGITPPTAPVQSVGGGIATADLMSYNKLLRNSELGFPDLARSKGRVTISYTNPLASCNGSIQFDIYKKYNNTGPGATYVPDIVGPDCWLPNEPYTYSVDQIASDNYGDAIGGDEYYWTILDSGGVDVTSLAYTSADKSSITLQTPGSLSAPYTITCCYGRANPWDGNNPLTTHTTCVSKTIGGEPTLPAVTIPSCVDIGDNSFLASVTSPQPGYLYQWTSSNPAWILSASGAQNENLSVTSLGDGPGTITLKIDNQGCNSADFLFEVKRRFVSPDVAITGPVTCLSAGNSYTFSVIPASVQTNFTEWTLPQPPAVPTAWNFTPLNGTESIISLNVPANTPAGAYTLSANGEDCAGNVSLTVYVRPADPTIVAGATCIDHGDLTPITYTVSPAGPYQWTIPAGWSGVSSTETITLTPNGTTTGTVKALGLGTAGCNSVNQAQWIVNFNPIEPDAATVGCFNFGVNGTTSVTINNAPTPTFFGTYLVSSTPTGLLNSPPASVDPLTGQITLNTLSTASGSYTVHISHQTGCGTSAALDIPVTVNGVGSILVMTPVGGIYDLYQVIPPVGGATYNWFIDSNPVLGYNQPFLALTGPSPGPTEVCVDVVSGGCTTRLCTPGGTHSRSAGTEDPLRESGAVKVFPNPNDGNFVVELPAEISGQGIVRLADAKGATVGTYKLRGGKNFLSAGELASGTYFLFITVDGKEFVHRMQVSGN